VLRVDPTGRIVVENLNVAKKHQRPNPQRNVPGGIVEQEKSLDVSNVMLFNPTTQKADRVGFRRLADGRKVRFFKGNGEVVDT
jgi:large subunit ribosomal protein L24